MIYRDLLVALGCGLLLYGCASPKSEADEIIDNLTQAGFPVGDITIADGAVWVGRDARVSLAASREMLEDDADARSNDGEQYRTTNVISSSLLKICIDGSRYSGAFSTALDLAIQNFNELPLTFAMARTPSPVCNFTITALLEANTVGGHAGFPSNGQPFPTFTLGTGLVGFSVDTIEHVITHEIGHTIGFRHSDFFDRSISCNGAPENEGDAGIGAVLIPGTPSGASPGASLMNSCFREIETGEFSATDVIAIKKLYVQPAPPLAGRFDNDADADIAFALNEGADLGLQIRTKLSNGDGTFGAQLQRHGDGSGIWNKSLPLVGDFNGDGRADIAFAWFAGPGVGLQIRTKLSNGDGTYTSALQTVGDGEAIWNNGPPVIGDFNGDGRDDLAFASFDGAGLGLHIRTKVSNGDGTYTSQLNRQGDDQAIWNRGGPLVGDFNADGLDDLAFAWFDAALGLQIRTKLSNGDGTYAARLQTQGDSALIWNAGPPLVGDFDNDGDADIAFAWYEGAGLGLNIRTKFSNRDGTYAQRVHRLGDGEGIWNRGAPLVGDFDGDGDADIAFAWQGGSGVGLQIRTKLSSGDGTFTSAVQNQGDGDGIWNKGSPFAGDFDGDGDSDIGFAWFEGSGLGLNIRTKLSNRNGTYTGRSHRLGDGEAIWNGSQQ